MQNTKYLVMLQAFFVRGFFNTMTHRVMCLVALEYWSENVSHFAN